MTDLHHLTAMEQRGLLETGDIRPVDLAEHYLKRIEQLNPVLHALTTVTDEAALARAEAIEDGCGAQGSGHSAERVSSLSGGELCSVDHASPSSRGSGRPSRYDSPLWGLPFADKDLTDRAGVPTSYGSRAFANNIAQTSSPLVIDMDAAGGVSLGKTNVPEFGFPAYAENRLPTGHARNPWDTERDPGGSSSGAAVAVAARMLPFAPGSDGGGSVRIPAAACGLVGLKPSRGRVPGASGIDSLGGLAVGGPLARTVADAALLLDGMCRGTDRFALRAPSPNLPPTGSFVDALMGTAAPGTTPASASAPIAPQPLRIGWNTWSPWARQYDITVGPEAEETLAATIRLAEKLGHRVARVEPTPFPEYVDAFRAIWMGGASGLPVPDEILDQLEPLTSWLIRTGRTRPAGDLPRALAALSRFESQIIADYAPYDLVLTPVLTTPALPISSFDPADGNLNFIQQCQFTPFTSYLNVAGLPAISMPVGEATLPGESLSLPMGVQAIGRPGDEVTLLRFAAQLESELCWQERVPQIA